MSVHCGDLVKHEGIDCEIVSCRYLDFGDVVAKIKLPDGTIKENVLIPNEF